MEEMRTYSSDDLVSVTPAQKAQRREASAIKIQAIPTVYRGRQFRSRLEARWAAFFDLMKWNWDYEPIDLNGWIPDFVVGDFATGCYVEIKPIDFHNRSSWLASIATNELSHARDQVPATSRGFLVGGLRPWCDDLGNGLIVFPRLGAVWEPTWNRWQTPSLSRHMGRDIFDLAVGAEGNYPGLMTGLDFKDQDQSLRDDDIMPIWHEAGNIVQWKSPVRRQR